jgi:hypothetical protein
MLTTTERERFATSTAPPAPVREPAAPPAPTRRVRWWVVPLVLLVVFAGIVGAVVAAIVFDGDEVAIVPEWMPEYDVDTPAIFGPPATFWVGEDANLDPDLPRWMQSEYDVDSGLVGPLVVPAAIPFWVGADANLDADLPVWMQSEYDVDSGLVGPLVLPAAIPFWVGADANLDADLPVWMQSEYAVDTPASSYEPLPTIDFWVGVDAGLD